MSNIDGGQDKLKVYIKWKQSGEQIIDVKFQNSMIYAEPDVYMRMLHMFLEGYPEYDTDFPNEFDANLENNIPKYLKITCYDSLICLHDDQRVLACKARKVVFIYQTSHINSVKLDMYRVLKEFLFMQK